MINIKYLLYCRSDPDYYPLDSALSITADFVRDKDTDRSFLRSVPQFGLGSRLVFLESRINECINFV